MYNYRVHKHDVAVYIVMLWCELVWGFHRDRTCECASMPFPVMSRNVPYWVEQSEFMFVVDGYIPRVVFPQR